jgi:murein DD-endopeptidase MepM/ murein hydrolase activator NlpD
MNKNKTHPVRKWRAPLLAVLFVGLIGWLFLSQDLMVPESVPAGKEAIISTAGQIPTVAGLPEPLQHVVQRGDNLFDILSACGIPATQIDQLVKSTKNIHHLSALTAGNALKIWVTPAEPASLLRLRYEIDGLNELEAEVQDDLFTARKITHDVEVRYDRAEGTIASSLYASAIGAGVSPEIVMGLTDIFAWDINFFTDIREGDTYTILYERHFVRGTFKGYGKILAARFVNQGEERVAVHYRQGGEGGYYDATGKPIRKLFLKAPLNYRRISSGFTHSRMHPVFQVKRPHLGVDYAAPSGTPVVALGAGTVVFKGWSGGFGKSVRIQHANGYVTYYGHLSGYVKGLAKGSRVRQGQVIGYVGSTGISTGPHLDLRVTLNGKFINPLTLRPVNGPPLQGENLAHFKHLSEEKLALLKDVSISGAVKLGANAPRGDRPS